MLAKDRLGIRGIVQCRGVAIAHHHLAFMRS
jgi:hypothetical protein